jgi:HEAT repeats
LNEPTRSSGSRKPDFPPPGRASAFDPTSGPALELETIDKFLEWLASVPVGHVDVIGERIAAARGDKELLNRLLDELEVMPVRDVSRHRLLLATIGELRDPAAVDRLARFVWYQGAIAPSLPVQLHTDRPCRFESEGASEMLRMRAAEMLAYIGGEEATRATLKVAAVHPERSVRLAAADAYLFGRSDSPEALEILLEGVPDEDRDSIGLPRLTRETDMEEFQRAVFGYYERYPEQLPSVPARASVGLEGGQDV